MSNKVAIKGMESFVGCRKHVSQMSEVEVKGLFKRLKDVEKSGKRWNISGHTFNRIAEKGIIATYEDIVSAIHNATMVEYKIDRGRFDNAIEERVVLRSKDVVNKSYNLNVVYSLTNRKIITVWINHIKDRHATLDWSIYKEDMTVFGI